MLRAVLSVCAVGLLIVAGCAAGRGPAGEVIVGWDVAKLPETASEAARAAAQFLPEPWQSIAIGAGTLLFGGGAVGVASARAKKREDAAWDEAQRIERERAELARARADAAYDEAAARARAGSVPPAV